MPSFPSFIFTDLLYVGKFSLPTKGSIRLGNDEGFLTVNEDEKLASTKYVSITLF